MLRPALTAGLMILALAAPAAADGFPEPDRAAPAAFDRAPAGYRPASRPSYAPLHRRYRSARVPHRGGPVRPVSYGEPDGTVFHAWLPRNTNLPIYNIPPPYFPEP
ncbi:hypothetical protein [Methylobacterium platani]|uniref:Uncharacterized protein n=2 Tax=Methylobacterium platani TaxID=427683 RepID=A0A179SH37_9HYPH|nr:hypothetical protein [Methylobacterium platani]KMO14349.1 hypothetical protein SQ03_19795 [Methylobacterium platani JCM 14648]OAS27186.1 hypothetical protein A5481_01780 [Methylobacterium platani]